MTNDRVEPGIDGTTGDARGALVPAGALAAALWLYLAGPVLVGVAYGAETVSELGSPAGIALVAYFLLPANVYLYG